MMNYFFQAIVMIVCASTYMSNCPSILCLILIWTSLWYLQESEIAFYVPSFRHCWLSPVPKKVKGMKKSCIATIREDTQNVKSISFSYVLFMFCKMLTKKHALKLSWCVSIEPLWPISNLIQTLMKQHESNCCVFSSSTKHLSWFLITFSWPQMNKFNRYICRNLIRSQGMGCNWGTCQSYLMHCEAIHSHSPFSIIIAQIITTQATLIEEGKKLEQEKNTIQ